MFHFYALACLWPLIQNVFKINWIFNIWPFDVRFTSQSFAILFWQRIRSWIYPIAMPINISDNITRLKVKNHKKKLENQTEINEEKTCRSFSEICIVFQRFHLIFTWPVIKHICICSNAYQFHCWQISNISTPKKKKRKKTIKHSIYEYGTDDIENTFSFVFYFLLWQLIKFWIAKSLHSNKQTKKICQSSKLFWFCFVGFAYPPPELSWKWDTSEVGLDLWINVCFFLWPRAVFVIVSRDI